MILLGSASLAFILLGVNCHLLFWSGHERLIGLFKTSVVLPNTA